MGVFQFRRVKKERFFGFSQKDLGGGQSAYLAEVEKAMLDLVYLHPGGEEIPYLSSLRLQNLEQINPQRLRALAEKFSSPKIERAAENIILIKHEA